MAISHTARIWKIILNTGTAGTRIEVCRSLYRAQPGDRILVAGTDWPKNAQEPERKGANSQVKGV